MVEKQWLESNRYYSELDESKLTSIFYFALIWNLFEKECCGKFAKMDEHPKQLSEHAEQVSRVMLQDVWCHFQQRYIANDKPTQLFKSFAFQPRDNKAWVEAILRLDAKATEQEKLEALLRIAFRLRNNLYHGEKSVSKLYEQNENFRQINQILMALIDAKQGRQA